MSYHPSRPSGPSPPSSERYDHLQDARCNLSLPHVEIGHDAPPAEHRNPVGWALFSVLALLMIGGQLVAYFGRTPNAEFGRAAAEEELRTEIATKGISKTTVSIGLTSSALQTAITRLKPTIGKDPESALLYAAIKTESNVPIDPKELVVLKASRDPGYHAGYTIYSSEKLSRADAEKLAAALPNTKFLYKLVASHALEKAGDRTAIDRIAERAADRAILGEAVTVPAFFIGLILLFGYVVARAGNHLKPLGMKLYGLTGPDADRLALRSAEIFCSFLTVALVLGPILSHTVSSEFAQLPTYVAIAVIIVLLARVPIAGKWVSLKAIGISKDGLGRHIAWGVGGALANLPIIGAVQLVSLYIFKGLPAPEHPVTVEISDTASPLMIVQLTVIAAVFAPFIEEIMFRGTLFPALASVLKRPVLAALISSLIFAAIHPTGIPAWAGLATIGCMSCFLSYQTRSLVPSIVMHATHNFLTLVVTLLMLR